MAKVLPTSQEMSVIEQLDAAAMASEEPKKRGRIKRPKGPPPLSVKCTKMKHAAHISGNSELISRSQVEVMVRMVEVRVCMDASSPSQLNSYPPPPPPPPPPQ